MVSVERRTKFPCIIAINVLYKEIPLPYRTVLVPGLEIDSSMFF